MWTRPPQRRPATPDGGRRPERTCIGCREKATQDELLRIARPAGGTLRVGGSRVAPGRGAYVHPRAECVRAAFSRGRVARALRTELASDEAARLLSEIEGNVRS